LWCFLSTSLRKRHVMEAEQLKMSKPALFILLFIKSHILFLHILLVFAHLTCFCTSYLSCTSCFALFFILLHILHFISLFYLYIYICSCVVLLLYNLYSLHCPLSGPDLIYISLLIIPCIIYHVTNKETLNLEPWKKSQCSACSVLS